MSARDIAVLMPCWKCPELLRVSVPSVLGSLTTDSELIVVLNEADEESIKILGGYGVRHVDKELNYGPAGIDFLMPLILEEGFKWVANINSDMLLSKGWDRVAVEILKERGPCSVSLVLVEPRSKHGPPIRIVDDLRFFDEGADETFQRNVAEGKYETTELRACSHPIITTMDDFTGVGGYSDGMDIEWIRAGGSCLDPYFAWRLHRRHEGGFQFIRTSRAFAYHHSSYNRSKFGLLYSRKARRARREASRHFCRKTGTTVGAFAKRAGING